MPKVSIIVPIYNTEKYLQKCIESICNQTLRDIEIILVNDGSTDGSSEICEKYKLQDNRIIVIHKENNGLSSARNTGLDIAKGEYIGFVDSDDFIDKDMYKILYELCTNYDCEIASSIYTTIKDFNDIDVIRSENISIYDNKEAVKKLYTENIFGYSVCNKLFKRQLFEGEKFPIGRIYEDASLIYKIFAKSKQIIFIDRVLYYYIYRENSITTSKVTAKRFDVDILFKEIYSFMRQNYPEMCNLIKSMHYNSLRNIVVDIVNEKTYIKNYRYINRASKLIRKELKAILNNELVSKKHKLLAIVISYIPFISIVYYLKKSNI